MRVLYLPPGGGGWGCRACHRLAYTSSQESRRADGPRRWAARLLGEDEAVLAEAFRRRVPGLGDIIPRRARRH